MPIHEYKKEFVHSDDSFIVSYWYKGVRHREVDVNQDLYVAWLNVPNTPAEITLDLAGAQAIKIKAIDTQTYTLLAAHFEYPAASGNFCYIFAPEGALSDPISDYLGMAEMAEHGTMVYTYKARYVDGTALEFANKTEFDAFFDAISLRVSDVRTQGSTFKDTVSAATTIADVEAVDDNRT